MCAGEGRWLYTADCVNVVRVVVLYTLNFENNNIMSV